MISRNKSHEYGVQALYAMLIFVKEDIAFDLPALVSGVTGHAYADIPLFLKETLINAVKHYGEIVSAITPYLVNWKFERLNLVTQAILIYSYAVYFYTEDTNKSKAVIINVAIKLAKLYSPDEDYKFINAVLDGVLK